MDTLPFYLLSLTPKITHLRGNTVVKARISTSVEMLKLELFLFYIDSEGKINLSCRHKEHLKNNNNFVAIE